MKNNFLKKITFNLLILLTFSFSVPAFATKTNIQEGEILCFGADLNESQEKSLREYFNSPDNIDAVYVDNTVAARQLGYSDFTGGWYSSAYVKINENGTGINVKSNNLTLVTNGMLANALITSGITDADIIASAPFPVTGESALAGIFEGAERIIGIELKPEGKQVAQEEVEVTLDVADSIGSVEATALINEVKARVIKEAPKTTDEISEIVSEVSSNLDININEATKEKVVSLMNKINNLDIDYDVIKDSIKQNSSKLLNDLKSLGNEIKESGILERMWIWIKNLIEKWTTS